MKNRLLGLLFCLMSCLGFVIAVRILMSGSRTFLEFFQFVVAMGLSDLFNDLCRKYWNFVPSWLVNISEEGSI